MFIGSKVIDERELNKKKSEDGRRKTGELRVSYS